jgi:rhamnosyltransferase subunit B
MKFAIVTLGSAGDLHPFLAVARALVERGHEVHLLTQAPYESAVRAEGVRFLSIAGQENHDRTLGHPLLWHPLHGFGVLWRHLAVPAIGPTIEALDLLSRGGAMTVLASPLAAGARLARERWPDRIRLLSGYTAPMGLRSTADPMFLGAWRVPAWLPTVARRGLWSALDRWKLEPMAQPALRNWTKRLDLPALSRPLFGDALHSPDGGIALYPDWFAPVPAAWAARGVRQTGFPVFEPAQPVSLPHSATRFVEDRRPFVVFYPGSAEQRAQSFAERVLPVSQALGLRVLMLSRLRSGFTASEDFLELDSAPLGRILPGAAAFVHHGGIGSAAQAMAAHTPQLVLASAYDQFENGARLEKLRQGHWQPNSDATQTSVRAALQTLLSSASAPALAKPPQPSLPGAPNQDVVQACKIIENSSK